MLSAYTHLPPLYTNTTRHGRRGGRPQSGYSSRSLTFAGLEALVRPLAPEVAALTQQQQDQQGEAPPPVDMQGPLVIVVSSWGAGDVGGPADVPLGSAAAAAAAAVAAAANGGSAVGGSGLEQGPTAGLAPVAAAVGGSTEALPAEGSSIMQQQQQQLLQGAETAKEVPSSAHRGEVHGDNAAGATAGAAATAPARPPASLSAAAPGSVALTVRFPDLEVTQREPADGPARCGGAACLPRMPANAPCTISFALHLSS